MVNRIDIVVAARDRASAQLTQVNNQIATMSARFNDASRRAALLAQEERRAADEVQRLDRLVRFMGSGASDNLRDRLALAQVQLNDVRGSIVDVNQELRETSEDLGRANLRAMAFALAMRHAADEAARLERQANRLDRRIFRRVGREVDRLGDSIRQVASSALTSAIDSVSGALQGAARNVVMFAAVAPFIAGVAVAAAGAIGDLTGIVSILPSAILAGAASLAVFKLGLQGVSEAFEAGLAGDADKFKEAMKGLNVHAQEFVKSGLRVVEAWKPLQKVVQGRLFRGASQSLKDVNSVIQPLAEKWLPKIANLFAQAGTGIAGFFKSAGTSGQLDTIMDGVWRNIDGMLKSIPFLMQAFLDIGEVGASMFGDIGQGVGSLAERFAGWIRGLKESGELQAWADRARDAFETLGRIAGDVGRVIKAVFKNGSDEGQTFLENIEEQTTRWAEFMESADGAKLVDSLGAIGAAMGHVVGVIQFLSEVWLGWVAIYQSGVAYWNQGWQSMIQIATSAISTILSGLVSLLGWIPGIGDRLRQSQRDFEAWRNNSVANLQSTQGAVAGVQNSLNNMHGKTVYIDVVQRGPTLGGSGGYRGFAGGGYATGIAMVGEHGPELVDFGRKGAQVYSNSDSKRMVREGADLGAVGGGGGAPVQVSISVEKGSGGDLADLVMSAIYRGAIKLVVNSAGRVAVA